MSLSFLIFLGAPNTTYLIVEAVSKGIISTSVPGEHSVPGESSPVSGAPSGLLPVVPPIIVGFVEVALTREHCFVLAADAPYREFRPKMTSLVVDTQFRRRGIASLLLSACVAQSKIWSGHSELFLEVRNENRGAILFYTKNGFRECTGETQFQEQLFV